MRGQASVVSGQFSVGEEREIGLALLWRDIRMVRASVFVERYANG